MHLLRRVLDAMSSLLLFVGGVAVMLMMLQIVTDATLRTFFGTSVPGTPEFVAFYYMVAVTFLPLAYIQRTRSHVIIELFTSGLRPRAIAWIECAIFFLAAVAMAFFCAAATGKAIAMTAIGEYVIGMTLIVTWPARWLLALGTGLTSLYLFLNTVDEFLVAAGFREPLARETKPH